MSPERTEPAAAPADEMDERLARLLAVEQRLESDLRRAEDRAREMLDGARAGIERERAEGASIVEAAARREADADLVAHRQQIEAIAARAAAAVARLESVSPEAIDALARRVLARVLQTGNAPP